MRRFLRWVLGIHDSVLNEEDVIILCEKWFRENSFILHGRDGADGMNGLTHEQVIGFIETSINADTYVKKLITLINEYQIKG